MSSPILVLLIASFGSRGTPRLHIRYIGFYDLPEYEHEGRNSFLAATNKMDYICQALIKSGHSVQIVSPSWSKNLSFQAYRGRTTKITKGMSVTLLPTFTANHRFTKYAQILFSLLCLTAYLIFHTRNDEIILVYHTPWFYWPLRVLKRIIKCKLILEVEEVYQDVVRFHPYLVVWETRLLHLADAYLFANDLLPKVIKTKKPYATIYGVYKPEKVLTTPAQDGKIHLVYAGIIDQVKRGAFNAAESALWLDERYLVHIIGFGKQQDIANFKTRLAEINKTSRCKVIFDGQKSDDEYVAYMQRCHIGLSTQTITGKYLATSFPSKILSYLSLGLRVVSSDIECVRISKIGKLVTYYMEDTPQAIAEAVKAVDFTGEFDSRVVLQELDNTFTKDISGLLTA